MILTHTLIQIEILAHTLIHTTHTLMILTITLILSLSPSPSFKGIPSP